MKVGEVLKIPYRVLRDMVEIVWLCLWVVFGDFENRGGE